LHNLGAGFSGSFTGEQEKKSLSSFVARYSLDLLIACKRLRLSLYRDHR
jgi:hypothetical protein